MISLLHGDCMELMGSLQTGSINFICVDPPYGTTMMDWDKTLPFEPLWKEYDRLLAPGGVVAIFGSQPFSAAVIMSNLKWFKYELIWDKNKCGSPGLAKIRPMKTHENILIFSRERGTYNPQMVAGEPYSRKSKNPDGYVGRCNNHQYGLKPKTEFSNEGTRYPKSVLSISRDFSAQQQVHPTQKPVPVLEWLVKTYSNEGDGCLDHCMGSGSMGVACKKLGRRFIGIERDEGYFNIAKERINGL